MKRVQKLMRITKRLIILAGLSLVVITILFNITWMFGNKLMISYICLLSGILGGFVSIQQRLPKIKEDELDLLSESWFQILLIPIYGGVFALVLYVLFLSGLISGHLFPEFNIIPFPKEDMNTEILKNFLIKTYPSSGQDFCKLLFWCFVAGFSERFVPQIISDMSHELKPE